MVVRVLAPHGTEVLAGQPRQVEDSLERIGGPARVVAVVTGRDRGVGGEDGGPLTMSMASSWVCPPSPGGRPVRSVRTRHALR